VIRLTRRYRFSASHRLFSPSLTDSQNAELYGKCSNPHGHGHDYVLEICVHGPLDARTGRVVDVARLDALVEAKILSLLRHRDLNTEAGGIAGAVPTTENLASGIRDRLLESWQGVFPGEEPRLHRVRVHETRKNVFEIPASI
jgi:6-pyruvoyltetrahydropterin/6-carboxytetrahydropterin synthase